jgi:hypothetical protein
MTPIQAAKSISRLFALKYSHIDTIGAEFDGIALVRFMSGDSSGSV